MASTLRGAHLRFLLKATFPGWPTIHLNKVSPFPHLRLGNFADSSKKEKVLRPRMQWRTFRGKKGVYKTLLPSLLLEDFFNPHTHLSSVQDLFGTLVSLQALSRSCPQHVVSTVRTLPFLAQATEALHGDIVFENSFLQAPRNLALESPEAR